MNDFIEIVRISLSYCHNCYRAVPTATLRCKDWEHEFNLCSICLERIKNEVLKSSGSLCGGIIENVAND